MDADVSKFLENLNIVEDFFIMEDANSESIHNGSRWYSSVGFGCNDEKKPNLPLETMNDYDNVEKHYQYASPESENIVPYGSHMANISRKRSLMFNSGEEDRINGQISHEYIRSDKKKLKSCYLTPTKSSTINGISNRYSYEVQDYIPEEEEGASFLRNFNTSLPAEITSTPKLHHTNYTQTCKAKSAEKNSSASRKNSVLISSEPAPLYRGYQLLGDSQLLRFSKQILRISGNHYYSQHGFCVSGQTIEDLECRLSKKETPLHDKVILMIGTNNLTRKKSLFSMCGHFDNILKLLEPLTQRIVILTVPPVPKLDGVFGSYHLNTLKQFNRHILSKKNGKNIHVVDFSPAVIGYDNKIDLEFYENPNARGLFQEDIWRWKKT